MIRPAVAEDFDFIYSLYFHPEINPFLLYEMMEKSPFQPIYADLLSKNCLFVFEANGQKVGMSKLYPHTYRSDHVGYLGGVAIDTRFSGQGFGQQMLEEMLAFGKQKGYLRIELSAAITNEKAIRLYEKVGFEKEGILRKYTYLKSKNLYLDEVLMSYLM
jgi:L-phenylalanine/L-methionine N-acetyltransferase